MAELPVRMSAPRSYAIVIGSRIRSQYAYRTSFWLTVATSVGIGLIEFVELYAILANVPVFGGMTFAQAALVFALANMGFSLADMIFGQFDAMPTNLRMGRLEVLLVRPMPLMAQLVTADFQLRRLGRVGVGLVIMIIALATLELPLTPTVLYLLIITPFVGGAIYGALFVLAGGIQFFLIDGAEFTSSFVYGGSYAGQLPGSVLLDAAPGAVHVRHSGDGHGVPAHAVDLGSAGSAVPAGLARLVRAAVRDLGLGAWPCSAGARASPASPGQEADG